MLSPSDVVSPDEVSAELERVLASPNFNGANQLAYFLRFVVEETLAGRGQSLKQYTIAVKALGRSSGFDPQTDTIVRVQAGRLRRALQRYYNTLAVDNPVIIELPKGSYIPRFQYGPVKNPTPAKAVAANSTPEPHGGRPSKPATSVSVTPDPPPALPVDRQLPSYHLPIWGIIKKRVIWPRD